MIDESAVDSRWCACYYLSVQLGRGAEQSQHDRRTDAPLSLSMENSCGALFVSGVGLVPP